MAITLDEVKNFGATWFDTVSSNGSSAEQAAFFLNANPRIYLIDSGMSVDMDTHENLHAQWIDEMHQYGNFNLTVLSESPERARAVGTVYWQATYKDSPKNIIKAIFGEDWIIEKDSSGELKFVLYMSTFHHLFPESAPFVL